MTELSGTAIKQKAPAGLFSPLPGLPCHLRPRSCKPVSGGRLNLNTVANGRSRCFHPESESKPFHDSFKIMCVHFTSFVTPVPGFYAIKPFPVHGTYKIAFGKLPLGIVRSIITRKLHDIRIKPLWRSAAQRYNHTQPNTVNVARSYDNNGAFFDNLRSHVASEITNQNISLLWMPVNAGIFDLVSHHRKRNHAMLILSRQRPEIARHCFTNSVVRTAV